MKCPIAFSNCDLLLLAFQMVSYVRKKCSSLTDAQRQQLAVSMDDIIFLLPEDVSVFFDQYGKVCYHRLPLNNKCKLTMVMFICVAFDKVL